jgi:transposase
VTEQRYKAVLAVIADGRTVTQVARDWDVARQTVHVWLERYEADGLEGLSNDSHRPAHCPHQMPATVEAQLLEMRRGKPYWGARRLALELARKGVQPAHSKSAVYRSLVRAGVIDPLQSIRGRDTANKVAAWARVLRVVDPEGQSISLRSRRPAGGSGPSTQPRGR